MSHVSQPVFAAFVWGGLGSVVAVFVYLVYALRRAGALGLGWSDGEGPDDGANR